MASTSLVDRKVETDTIDDLLQSGGSLNLTGPPGIGKSTLLLEAENAARERRIDDLDEGEPRAEPHA